MSIRRFRAVPGLLAPILACALCAGPHQKINEIKMRGSDSEVNLVQRLAEVFAAGHPNVSIAVTGGGSGVGVAALIDGMIDIANSSRPLLPEEQLLALRKSVRPVATIFAMDALSIVVHPTNRVKPLTLDEIAAIYSGKTTTWDSLGGSGPIVLYGRQASSGTYVFFRDVVVGADFPSRVREMNGNAQIAEAVSRDERGVGYLAVGYLHAQAKRLRVVPIQLADGRVVSPTDLAAVRAGRYPITRPLFQYTNGPPRGAVLELLRFELSAPGQTLIRKMGFYPPLDRWRQQDTDVAEKPGPSR